MGISSWIQVLNEQQVFLTSEPSLQSSAFSFFMEETGFSVVAQSRLQQHILFPQPAELAETTGVCHHVWCMVFLKILLTPK